MLTPEIETSSASFSCIWITPIHWHQAAAVGTYCSTCWWRCVFML